jgi:hypothetical protein
MSPCDETLSPRELPVAGREKALSLVEMRVVLLENPSASCNAQLAPVGLKMVIAGAMLLSKKRRRPPHNSEVIDPAPRNIAGVAGREWRLK